MGKVLVDGKVEVERSAFIHALVRLDRQSEVEDIVRVWERSFHRLAEGAFEFCQIWKQH